MKDQIRWPLITLFDLSGHQLTQPWLHRISKIPPEALILEMTPNDHSNDQKIKVNDEYGPSTRGRWWHLVYNLLDRIHDCTSNKNSAHSIFPVSTSVQHFQWRLRKCNFHDQTDALDMDPSHRRFHTTQSCYNIKSCNQWSLADNSFAVHLKWWLINYDSSYL